MDDGIEKVPWVGLPSGWHLRNTRNAVQARKRNVQLRSADVLELGISYLGEEWDGGFGRRAMFSYRAVDGIERRTITGKDRPISSVTRIITEGSDLRSATLQAGTWEPNAIQMLPSLVNTLSALADGYRIWMGRHGLPWTTSEWALSYSEQQAEGAYYWSDELAALGADLVKL